LLARSLLLRRGLWAGAALRRDRDFLIVICRPLTNFSQDGAGILRCAVNGQKSKRPKVPIAISNFENIWNIGDELPYCSTPIPASFPDDWPVDQLQLRGL